MQQLDQSGYNQWPNLKNLSSGLNLGPRFKYDWFHLPALNLNRVLADLNRGSNSLNSISDYTTFN